MRIDLSNALRERVGEHGLSHDDIDEFSDRLSDVQVLLSRERGNGYRFMDLPFETDGGELNRIGNELREQFEAFVNIGIGGSALGGATLTHALHPGEPAYFLDNVDPVYLERLLGDLDLDSTVFNVVSKSGLTAETAANFLIVRDKLQSKGLDWTEHVVVTTGEEGVLRETAEKNDVRVLGFPGVPGRYSALSNVGLLSASYCGVDVREVLEGGRRAVERCCEQTIQENPALALGGFHYLLRERRGKSISVMMPYLERLETFAEWYSQLWAESLGKSKNRNDEIIRAGQTPVKSVGVTDQHSLLQLFREGPNDKVITFVEVNDEDDVVVPENTMYPYLSGTGLSELRSMELSATRASLVEADRPNILVSMDSLDPGGMGELLHTYLAATVVTAELFGVDAFHQPGVELGKRMTYGLLGRDGFEGEHASVQNIKKTLFDV